MPLVSIFWVSFWYAELLVKIGLRLLNWQKLTTNSVPMICLHITVPEHVLTAQFIAIQWPVLRMCLSTQVHLPHVTRQICCPHATVPYLLVNPSIDMLSRVARHTVGKEEQVVPFQTNHQTPICQRCTENKKLRLIFYMIILYLFSSFLLFQFQPITARYKTNTAMRDLILGMPWVSRDTSCNTAICTIMTGVLNRLVMTSPSICLNREVWLFIVSVTNSWKEAVKVITQTVDPMGTPSKRCWIGASVSCHVHQRNLMPVKSYGA